jgi:response regulator RpfG family c-di-GMP phosphodiesterase
MDWQLPYFILSGLTVALLAATLMLARAYLSLRRDHAALAAKLAQQQNDLIGLSAAAVQVDQRLLNQERRLRECDERLASLSLQDTGYQSYRTAIERLKGGVAPQDLASQLGLSLSEANLLAHLYAERQDR